MKIVAIIPARGGSKRIPRKSIKEFCGKPILSYSIEAALQSELFSEVMVSTEDTEIAEMAKRYGAVIPFMRSAETASDYASTADVLKEVLACYLERGKTFDYMCCLYPAAPFVTPQKLREAYQCMINANADSVMPVVKYSYPPQRALVIRNGILEYQYPEHVNRRSQDLEPIYHDCGQFYFYKVKEGLSFDNDKFVPIVMPEEEVQDIDNESDWTIAEMKYKLMVRKKGQNDENKK